MRTGNAHLSRTEASQRRAATARPRTDKQTSKHTHLGSPAASVGMRFGARPLGLLDPAVADEEALQPKRKGGNVGLGRGGVSPDPLPL